jgi:hypothetical protein
MHISILKYIIHTVYILHVSATHVAVFREVHYKGSFKTDNAQQAKNTYAYNGSFKIISNVECV